MVCELHLNFFKLKEEVGLGFLAFAQPLSSMSATKLGILEQRPLFA